MSFNCVCGVITDNLGRHLVIEQLLKTNGGLIKPNKFSLSSTISIETVVTINEKPLEILVNKLHNILKIPIKELREKFIVEDNKTLTLKTTCGNQLLFIYNFTFIGPLKLKTAVYRRASFLSFNQITKAIANNTIAPTIYSKEVLRKLPIFKEG